MTNAERILYDVDNIKCEYAHGRMTAVQAVQKIREVANLSCSNCFYIATCTTESHFRCEDGYKAYLEANL